MPDQYKCKIFQQNTSKQNSTADKKDHTLWSTESYARMVQHMQSINVIGHINIMKDRNDMIISTDAEKHLVKFTPYHNTNTIIQTPKEWGMERTYLNIIKFIYDKSTVNIILNGKRLKACLQRSGVR